jgi:hypothetical protein
MNLRMPKILTASWFTKLPTDAVPVGISRGTPRRRGGYRRLRALEPGTWFRTVPPARYIELYRDILDRLDPAEIYNQLLSYAAADIKSPDLRGAAFAEPKAAIAGDADIGFAFRRGNLVMAESRVRSGGVHSFP